MTPVVTWTTLSDSPQPLFLMRKKIRSTYKVCLLVRRRVLNCVLSAKGVFEKVPFFWRERRSVEQSGSCSGVSFGICLIDPYQCINLQKWRLTFVNLPDLSSSTNFTKWKGKCEDQRCQLLSIVNCKSAGWFASLQVWEIFQSSKDARTFLILWRRGFP